MIVFTTGNLPLLVWQDVFSLVYACVHIINNVSIDSHNLCITFLQVCMNTFFFFWLRVVLHNNIIALFILYDCVKLCGTVCKLALSVVSAISMVQQSYTPGLCGEQQVMCIQNIHNIVHPTLLGKQNATFQIT